jgi:hypothetical protein
MPVRRRPIQRNTAHVASLPAPVGGWNARDAYANMDPLDAITLTNLFPTTSTVEIRGGATTYATGMSGQVQSIFVYNGAATSKMFAVDATGKKIYDVTAGGAVGAAAVSGLTNALWEYANIATPGGNYMYTVNGVDKPELFDGTNWVAIDGVSTPAITGVTTTTLNNVLLFKNRMWFIQKNTLKAWYLPTQAVGGAAQSLDLSAVARKGGYLVDFDVWTTDAGYGLDDMLVFITSQGEIIIYRGTDPASAATWVLVGVWAFGAPVTNRCMLKYGGDLLVNTLDGLLPLSGALQSEVLDKSIAISNKIQNAISLASSNYGQNTGWDLLVFPASNALIVNVPIAVGRQQQYVMNTITRAWCNFTDWPANCWALFNQLPYYGGNGVVVAAWDSTFSDGSANIATQAQQAFNYFEERGVIKYFTRARPNILTTGSPTISIGVSLDFDTNFNGGSVTYAPVSYGLWDSGVWDRAVWGQGLTVSNNWQGITGIGYCASLQFASASMGIDIQWASTDVVFQLGWAGI